MSRAYTGRINDESLPTRIERRLPVFVLSVLLGVLGGCAAQSPRSSQGPGAGGRNADSLLVVDCLLPGQIRKLGQKLTYLAPRRATKTSASDCEIRGGEYVSYDRANYATALKVWLPQAQAGDAAAQTYVGEIYEKGLGLQADYNIAAQWYRKAAEQGYSRAQINLGYLHEGGLGVPQDLVTAMNWYRRASGFSDTAGDLEFVSSVEVARRAAARDELVQRRSEVQQLQGELSQTRGQLDQRRGELSRSQQDVSELRRRLSERRKAVAALPPPPPKPAPSGDSRRLAESEKKLQATLQEQRRLQAQVAQQQQEADALRDQLGKTQATLDGRKSEVASLQQEVDQTRTELDQRRQAADSSSANLREIETLSAKLREREAVLASQRTDMARLEQKLQDENTQLSAQLQTASRQEQQLKQQLSARERESASLQAELSQTEAQLAESRRANEQQTARLTALETELASREANVERQLQQARASQSGEVSGLQGQLADAQRELTDTRLQLAESRRAEQQQTAQLEALESQLAQREADTQRRLREAQASQSSEVGALQAQLAETRGKLGDTRGQLASARQAEADATARLSELETQLSQREIEVERELQQARTSQSGEVAALQTRLSDTQRQLADTRSQLAKTASARDVQVAQLEAQLKEQEAVVARQKADVAKLESDLAAGGASAAPIQSPASNLIAAVPVGPTIEIIEPPLALTRGVPTVKLRSAAPSVEIIGRVSAPKELMTFRINDQTHNTDDAGLFRATVPVGAGDTPVSMVAVDRSGSRSAVDFVLVPGQTATPQSQSNPRSSLGVKFGRYHGLIIGNNNYPHLPTLRTAQNDARAVEQVLKRKYGFDTTLIIDATRLDIMSALNELRANLNEDDNLLVYYAGHGELDRTNDRGNWLPVDAEPDSTANWISNIQITDVLNAMSAKHVLVVADSCYSGSLTRSSLARLQSGMTDDKRRRWLTAMSKTRSRTVLTSGGVAPVLDSGGGRHSVFAAAFLDVLASNDTVLEGYTIYREVQKRVKNATATLNVEQNPQYAPIKYAGHEAGEFFLLPRSVSGALEEAPTRFALAAPRFLVGRQEAGELTVASGFSNSKPNSAGSSPMTAAEKI